MSFLNRTDPFDLDRDRTRCLICGAFFCSCQTWLTNALQMPRVAEDAPPPKTRTINPKTYTRKPRGR